MKQSIFEITEASSKVMKKLQNPSLSVEGLGMDMSQDELSEIVHHFEEIEGGRVSIPELSHLKNPISKIEMGDNIYVEQHVFFNGHPGDTEVRYRFDKKTHGIFIEDILIA